MTTLYLVRHGQTDFSRENRFCGEIDPPLSAVGQQMADALGAKYGTFPWTAIYASPRTRTQQTAAPTATRAGLPIAIEDGLAEIRYGDWEGRLEAEVAEESPDRFQAWAEHPGLVSPPNGETAYDVARRAMAAVSAIATRHTNGTVLVVSHKATIRVLVCALLGVDVDQFRNRIAQRVCAVSVVEMKPRGAMLKVLGDVSHLPAHLQDAEGT